MAAAFNNTVPEEEPLVEKATTKTPWRRLACMSAVVSLALGAAAATALRSTASGTSMRPAGAQTALKSHKKSHKKLGWSPVPTFAVKSVFENGVDWPWEQIVECVDDQDNYQNPRMKRGGEWRRRTQNDRPEEKRRRGGHDDDALPRRALDWLLGLVGRNRLVAQHVQGFELCGKTGGVCDARRGLTDAKSITRRVTRLAPRGRH